MRGIIEGCVALMMAAILIAILPTEAEAEIYEDTVRLHILAASDSNEDQEIKLAIRDRILEKYGEIMGRYESIDEAEANIRKLTDEIEADSNGWLSELGVSYGVRVTLTREWYERREYADFSLPCGEYLSLKVILDGGEGQNWWCVMYPPLCLDIALGEETSGYSQAENRVIRAGKYDLKVKLMEICSEAFRKKG